MASSSESEQSRSYTPVDERSYTPVDERSYTPVDARSYTPINGKPPGPIKIEVETDDKSTETGYYVTLHIKPGICLKKEEEPDHFRLFYDDFCGKSILRRMRKKLNKALLNSRKTFWLLYSEKAQTRYKTVFKFLANFLSCDLCKYFLYENAYSHRTDYSKHNICENCARNQGGLENYNFNWHTKQIYHVLNKHVNCISATKCIYMSYGCRERNPPNDIWAEHEVTCGYQKVRCFFNNCHETTDYNELQRHIVHRHRQSIVEKLTLTEAFDASPKIIFKGSSTYVLMECLMRCTNIAGMAMFKAEPPIYEGNVAGSYVVKIYPKMEPNDTVEKQVREIHGRCLRSPLYILRYFEFVLQQCEKYTLQLNESLCNRLLLVGVGRLNVIRIN